MGGVGERDETVVLRGGFDSFEGRETRGAEGGDGGEESRIVFEDGGEGVCC